MQKIKKGDEVILIAGKDKGRKGLVLEVHKEGEYLVVEGINLVKKHVKANPNTNERGGVVMKSLPVHHSNVMLYNSSEDAGSRVGIRVLEDGTRVRYFKSTNDVVDV